MEVSELTEKLKTAERQIQLILNNLENEIGENVSVLFDNTEIINNGIGKITTIINLYCKVI